MRLTLRTLLAYLDDILDPHDAQLLQKKIENSEFATSLVHQIRGSVRRLRLDSPALDAQGIGADLNSVAEYLDNVLPPEDVPTLEKACLDSEVNLGEVASCHQILTLVLGEPADVTDDLRSKIYGIAPTAESPVIATTPDGVHITAHTAHPAVPPKNGPPTGASNHGPKTPLSQSVSPKSTSAGDVTTAPHRPDASTPPDAVAASDKASLPMPVETNLSPDVGATDATAMSDSTTVATKPNATRPIPIPSTKQAWRAEAEQGFDEDLAPSIVSYKEVERAHLAELDTSAGRVTSADRFADEYPDYLDRRSSWLRSAFVTGLIALLILAGLLFATGPIDNTRLSRWFGSEPKLVVQDKPTRSLEPSSTPRSFEPANDSAALADRDSVEIVDASPSSWPDSIQPEYGSSPAVSTANIPVPQLPSAGQPEPSEYAAPQIPSEPRQEIRVEGDGLPDLINEGHLSSDQASDIPVAQDPAAPLMPSTAPTESTALADSLPAEPREFELDVPESAANDFMESRELFKNENADEEVPPIPTPANDIASMTRSGPADLPLAPPAANAVPAVEGEMLSSSTINPPVASPIPALDDVAIVAPQPIEPLRTNVTADSTIADAGDVIMEEPAGKVEEIPPMEPTKLREQQLLLAFNQPRDSWIRVDSTIPLADGDTLMGLPAFRADIEIGQSVVFTMLDASRVQLGPASDVTLHSGRFLFRNNDPCQQGLRIQGERLLMDLARADGLVAVELDYQFEPGADFVNDPLHRILRVHALRQDVQLKHRGEVYSVAQGEHLIVLDDFEPRVEPSGEVEWAVGKSGVGPDDSAVRKWTMDVERADDMQLWLLERTSRRYNQRALAARSLAEMNHFGPIVKALNDPEQRAYWDRHFETLRRSLTRSPEAQDQLQAELEKAFGDKSPFILEMIRGYDARQLAAGAAAKLITYLDSNLLAHRVLAIQNLKQVTGYDLRFQPEDHVKQRRPHIKRWQDRLREGRVVFTDKPDIEALLDTFAAGNSRQDDN